MDHFCGGGPWRALSPTAQALYLWLKLEWKGPQANNNGKLRLSTRQAARAMGVTPDTAGRAFRDLQAKGFAVMTELPALGVEGQAKAPAYALTEIAGPPAREGSRLYRSWQEGQDFAVPDIKGNNPTGRNGRFPKCPKQNPVIEIMTPPT